VNTPTRFQRWLLPGFAFKAVVIGGGYATGRELVEFFMPSGPLGGLLGMLLAMGLWSGIAALTFLFARAVSAYDYGAFFSALLGPAAFLFDLAFMALLIIVMSVFGAAAGEIGQATFGWPPLVGTLGLILGIALFTTFGNRSVEGLFKWATYFLYLVYLVFFLLVFSKVGPRIAEIFSAASIPSGWAPGGFTYAAYNVFSAVAILPVLRHLTSQRDAIVAGLLCGPLGMLPALLFFICMVAWYPDITDATLPSSYVLTSIGAPVFHVAFQVMIFVAMLETGTGCIHSLNQRMAGVLARHGRELGRLSRATVATLALVLSVFVASKLGLVALIASGYRFLAWLIFIVFVAPLLTLGVWRLLRPSAPQMKTGETQS